MLAEHVKMVKLVRMVVLEIRNTLKSATHMTAVNEIFTTNVINNRLFSILGSVVQLGRVYQILRKWNSDGVSSMPKWETG